MSSPTLTIERERVGWQSRLLGRVLDYIELSKPRISLLVLVVVAVSYSLARWGQPVPWTLFHLLLGTTLVAASASTLNQWFERRRDAIMERTSDRPIPAGRLQRWEVLVFASVTITCGIAYLTLCVGWEPAFWSFLTWALYVWVYTPLKTISPINTAVGAVAGALPVLIGWSAISTVHVADKYDLRALSLFLLLFLWQFPHFMAIAWLHRRDYEKAGMKMLAVVDPTGRRPGIQATLAALSLIPVSLIPVLGNPSLDSTLYCIFAALMGLAQFACAVRFMSEQTTTTARNLLRASLIYLPTVLLLLVSLPWL